MSDVKQVIVMRKDLGMRKGKMIAQAAHASLAFLTEHGANLDYAPQGESGVVLMKYLTPVEVEWVKGAFTKICVYVNSEDELLQIHQAALDAGLSSHLITDRGLTEFGGVPTHTCIGIGPAKAQDIDKVTGHLPLL